MIRILVTACGGDVGQAIIKALRISRYECVIHGCDRNRDGVGSNFVDKFHSCPKSDDELYYATIVAICKNNSINAVIPATDDEIWVLTKGRVNFWGHTKYKLNAKLIAPDEKSLKYCDKFTALRKCDEVVNVGKFSISNVYYFTDDIFKDFHPPFIMKPRISYGSKGVRLIQNTSDVVDYLHDSENGVGLIQEYHKGDEYSIGVYHGKYILKYIIFKRTLKQGIGCSWTAELYEDKDISEYVIKIATHLKIMGAYNIQLIKTEKGPRLLEINVRFSSLTAARALAGFNDVQWCIDALPYGESGWIRTEPKEYKKIKFHRYFSELVDLGDGYAPVKEWQPK